jgi:hypothetical protein
MAGADNTASLLRLAARPFRAPPPLAMDNSATAML